jgi:hypothetical protein
MILLEIQPWENYKLFSVFKLGTWVAKNIKQHNTEKMWTQTVLLGEAMQGNLQTICLKNSMCAQKLAHCCIFPKCHIIKNRRLNM